MIRRLVSGVAQGTEVMLSGIPFLPPEVTQARVLADAGNRPWPVPDEPWLMAQTWRDLLFAHWPVAPEVVRTVIPECLPVDTFGDQAWIGITPFEVRGLRARGWLPVPGTSKFPELNVRAYTTLDGKPGIYFLSLDAASALAVAAARRAYRLPYYRARMQIQRHGAQVSYVSERSSRDGRPAEFVASYRPAGEVHQATAGSLEYFLTERYCLYTVDEHGTPLRADIHHPPWPLQPAEATVSRNSMTRPWGVDLPDQEPVLHLSRLQNVVIWPLRRVARTGD